jgi:hypothetical protein
LAKAGEGSFVASKEETESFFSTPSPDKKNRAKENEFNDNEPETKGGFNIEDGMKLAMAEDKDD